MKADQTIAQFIGIKEFPFKIKDKNGDIIYYENSDGYWYKRQFNSQGNQIYYETSNGNWVKRDYDSHGNQIYFENSSGYWSKTEYDSQSNQICYENSDGKILDNRPKTELTLEEIAEKFNIPVNTLRIKD